MGIILGIVIMAGVGMVAGCIVSPRFRTLLKGSGNLFLEDMSKTPKGAKIVYTQAIEEARNSYDKSCKVLSTLVGKATELNANLTKVTMDLEKVEKDCERLAKNQDMNGLQLKAQQRQLLLDKKTAYSDALMQLEPSVKEAEHINRQLQGKLNEIQAEKEKTLAELELANQMTEVYAQMDTLRGDSGTQKLLASAREGVLEAKRQAVGAQVVHNNKIESRIASVDRQLAIGENDDYVKELLEKYNKQ